LIVCSRNRAEFLEAAVGSLLAGDELPAELVIVDQSDVPNERLGARAAADSRLRYIWSETTGLCRASNLAVAAARHDLLVFTHDDVQVTAHWFGAMVRALLAAGPQAVVTGRVLPSVPETPGAFAPSTQVDETPRVVEGRSGIDILHPMNMAMFRQAVERAGGFDERIGPGTAYPGGEDHDFEFRLRAAGYRIVYAPEAVLYHRAWRAADEYLPLRWRYGRGQGAYYAKHLHWRDWWMLKRLRWDTGHRGKRFVALLPRQPKSAAGEMLFLLGTFAGIAEWLGVHRLLPRIAESFPDSGPISDVLPAPVAGPLPPATLIVCSRNRAPLLEESVQSILAGDEVPAELIIVDQSDVSNPRLAALTTERSCAIRYLHSHTRGECPARNAGIAAATYELLVFADDDVRVAPDWYGQMVRTLVAGGSRSAVTCRILPDDAGRRGGFVPTVHLDEMPAVYRGRTVGQPLYTVGLAIYRSAFLEVGGFDERLGAGGLFPGGEDGDLGYRLLEAGYQIIYLPQAVVYHRAWRPDADYYRVRWTYGIGHGAFCGKHLSRHDPYMLQRMGYEIWQKAAHFRERLATDRRRAVGDVVQVAGTLYGTARWLLTQRLGRRAAAITLLAERGENGAGAAGERGETTPLPRAA
jgi:GT2 family glycosyltransferase